MYAAAGVAAKLTAWTGRGVSERRLRALLPELTEADAAAARRESWAAALRKGVLDLALSLEGGPSPFPAIAAGLDPAALRPPLILATFHVGTPAALGAVLERLEGEVFAIQHNERPERPGLATSGLGDGQGHRAAIYLRALRTIRAGGFVFGAVDAGGSPLAVRVLGRPYAFSRGLLALSGSTGAPLLPLAARWRGRRIEVVAGPPLEPAPEEAMAAELVGWLEAFVRESPGQVTPIVLDRLVPPG
jgi:lauroyl/myristoyl acyltransferase